MRPYPTWYGESTSYIRTMNNNNNNEILTTTTTTIIIIIIIIIIVIITITIMNHEGSAHTRKTTAQNLGLSSFHIVSAPKMKCDKCKHVDMPRWNRQNATSNTEHSYK
jgi:hypothetical protein